MKTPLTLISAYLLTAATLQAQTFEWAKSFGGITPDGAYAIATDASGNVFTTGYFTGTVDFNPGAGTTELTSNGGGYDVFVQKMDASGNFLWAKSFGGTGSAQDYGYGIATDASGNVYTTGFFSGFADFNPGSELYQLSSAGSTDIFVQKLDALGNFVWAKSFGGASSDWGFSISVDATGNVYSTGFFQGTVDFLTGPGTANLTSVGETDIFVLKVDASGTFVWAKKFGGASSEYAYGSTTDALGNVYTTGFFQGTVDFDPGSGTENLTAVGFRDIFVQKMDASGNFLWARTFGQASDDSGWSVRTDASGNVYTTGYFYGTVDFDPGVGTTELTAAGYDILVHKMDASGNFLWARSIGGIGTDVGQSLSLDASGNVYTTGYFEGTVDFDPTSGTANLTAVGSKDVYVQKMDGSGNFLWAQSFEGTASEEARSLHVDGSGNVYITGFFDGTVDFDPSLSGNTALTTIGDLDIFVQKISQPAPVGIEVSGSSIQVVAYPNPNTGIVQIAVGQALNNAELTITDVQGKVIFQKYNDALSNMAIELPNATGIYFLTVKTPEGQSVIKLVKE